jgi:5-(carboxyamino)imidazole ribonucleotide synthase
VRVGILGAGQLGRMLALAGYPLGLEFVFLDPSDEACAARLGTHIQADYANGVALRDFCARVDVATYEFENVPLSTAEFVSTRVPLRPGPAALAASQDRLAEKKLFEQLAIPLPRYIPLETRAELSDAIVQLGMPAVLKTRTLGYDGKGQVVIKTLRDIEIAWAKLEGRPLILESFVSFEREVSCIAVRGLDKRIAFYPLIENVHRNGILYSSQPRLADPLQIQAEGYVTRLLEKLDYIGVLAFEFFVTDGGLLANEIAPRVHNSGHWSIEGADCSQFENHLRAICDLPLGATSLRSASMMLNCVGAEPKAVAVLRHAGVHLHRYGKEAKPQRKLAHVTLTAPNNAALANLRDKIEPLIPPF